MSPSISRRLVLQLGSGALIDSLAGCSALAESSPSSVRITHPHITNWVEQAFEVDLHLFDAGESIYWRTVHVDARESRANGQLGGARLERFPDEPGEYVLYARLVSVPEDVPVKSDLGAAAQKLDTPCLYLSLEIDTVGSREEEHPSVSIAYSADCDGPA